MFRGPWFPDSWAGLCLTKLCLKRLVARRWQVQMNFSIKGQPWSPVHLLVLLAPFTEGQWFRFTWVCLRVDLNINSLVHYTLFSASQEHKIRHRRSVFVACAVQNESITRIARTSIGMSKSFDLVGVEPSQIPKQNKSHLWFPHTC